MVLLLNDKKPTASYSQGQAFSFHKKRSNKISQDALRVSTVLFRGNTR